MSAADDIFEGRAPMPDCQDVSAAGTPRTSPTDRLAQILADSDDPIEGLLEIRPIVTGPAFNDLCIALEVCEVHMTDSQICRDDELSCPAGTGDSDVPEGQYLVGLPVGVHIATDGEVTVTVYAEDLTSALRKDEDADQIHLDIVDRYLDRGTALTATHEETP